MLINHYLLNRVLGGGKQTLCYQIVSHSRGIHEEATWPSTLHVSTNNNKLPFSFFSPLCYFFSSIKLNLHPACFMSLETMWKTSITLTTLKLCFHLKTPFQLQNSTSTSKLHSTLKVHFQLKCSLELSTSTSKLPC